MILRLPCVFVSRLRGSMFFFSTGGGVLVGLLVDVIWIEYREETRVYHQWNIFYDLC
jgi:hypothetical protein